MILQERDQRLLSALSTFRIVDREQVKALTGFSSTTRTNARLLALTRAGFLSRSFVGTVGSGRRAIYRLRSDPFPKERFVQHQLSTNEVHLQFLLHLPLGLSLRKWTRIRRPRVESIPLIPDGYAEVAGGGGIVRFYVEVDLGTEAGPVWRRKAEWYLRLALLSQERFRVLVVAHSDRRAAGIQKAVGAVTSKLFFLTDFATIKRDGFFSLIWLRPTGEERQSPL